MKIVTYILGALLAVVLGAVALFYITTVKPMKAENERFTTALPEFEKAKLDFKKCREAEKQATAWLTPVVDAAKKELGSEITAGKAEVAAAGGRVVVNISEELLYIPGSVTFSKDSVASLQKIAAMLKTSPMKDKEIFVGNMTLAVAASGKGKKKIPAKDARSLAAERSTALVKYLVEKGGVNPESLIAAAYPAALPEQGYKLKGQKAIIIINNTTALAAAAPKAEAVQQAKQPVSISTGTVAPAPKSIPITPAAPKTH